MRIILAALLALGPGLAVSQEAPRFDGGGAFDTVEIAGFLVPVADVERLLAARVLRFDPERARFSFAPGIGSERALRGALAPLPLEDARAVRDLYRSAKVPLPGGAPHVLTVPSAYGPSVFSGQPGRVSLGLGVGGVGRVPYTDTPDGGAGLGIGFGNSFEGVGVSLGVSLNDLSDIGNTDRISWGIALSRYLGDGFSLSVGGENLFVGQTDGQASFYIVGGWAFDKGALPFDGVATLGIGSGRFAEKTGRDRAEGKGRNATALFGALAWEFSENAAAIAEWNGRNLALGLGFRLPGAPVSVRLGVRDLTDFTGDGPRLTGSVGLTLARF